ncbi:TolC family protein [Aegicerativicinus sediminis]
MKRVSILYIFLVVSFQLFGQQTIQPKDTLVAFSLDEAINYAIENNRNSINASKSIEAAEEQKWETTSIGLPQIDAQIDYQNFLKQQVSLLPAAAFDPLGSIRQLEEYYDLTDRQIKDLPEAPEGFLPITFGTKQNMNASATLTQLLFDGSYLVGLQSAKVYLQISKNAKTKTDLEVRKAVINAYGNVLLTNDRVEILQRNLDVLKKNLNETSKLFENGMEEEESVEQLQITNSDLENALINTIRLRDLAYQMLNISLGRSLNAPLQLTDTLSDLAKKEIQDQLLPSDYSMENSVDYQIAENDMVSKELLLKLEKSRSLPTLSAFLSGGYNGNSDTFSFAKKDQRWFGYGLFGVNLSIPIFSSLGRSAATQRASIELEQAKLDLEETASQIQLEINRASSDFNYAIENFYNKEKNLKLAERIESKNQIKFFEGIAGSFDLRQAQMQLYTAQQEYLEAMLNVINSKAELETIINQPQYSN